MSDLNATAGAFCPLNGANASTVSLTPGAAATTVALPQSPNAGSYNVNGTTLAVAPSSGGAKTFCVDNSGTAYVFVAFGTAAQAGAVAIPAGATPGGFPCAPGVKTVITVPGNPGFVGAIAAATGTAVYVTPGDGKL